MSKDHLQAHNLMSYARKQGLDPVRTLDTYGMLLTSEKRRQITVEALREFRTQFERWQPHEFARRIRRDAGLTPAEMFEAIASYLDDYIAMKEKEAG